MSDDHDSGLDIPMDPETLQNYLQNPSGIADMLTKIDDGTGDSPAEVFADVINIIRADHVAIGRATGVTIEVERMHPDRAADLLTGSLDGRGAEIVETFNELEDQRERILLEVADRETLEQHREQKRNTTFTGP